MKSKNRIMMFALCLLALSTSLASAQNFPVGSKHFYNALDESKPDNDGFIRTWLLLDPIHKPLNNPSFNDSFLRKEFATEYFPGQYDLPKAGDVVKLDKKTKLKWHALESKNFNVRVFRFAKEQDMAGYNVVFFGYTIIDCTMDLVNVRLAAGSNSASMWWIDGEEVLLMSGDRRMVMDDCASPLMTLSKGQHILRVCVINGPGLSDFCARFIDEDFNPIKNFTIKTK